jgi:hypothetical protein
MSFGIKEREKEQEAIDIEDTQRLITEIETLKVVLYLVSRNKKKLDLGLELVLLRIW